MSPPKFNEEKYNELIATIRSALTNEFVDLANAHCDGGRYAGEFSVALGHCLFTLLIEGRLVAARLPMQVDSPDGPVSLVIPLHCELSDRVENYVRAECDRLKIKS